MSRALVALLAFAAGAAVANLYYAQPLLHTIATDFGVPEATAGLLVTATQLGYTAGLVLVVPLGDMLQRRRLVGCSLVLTAAGLAVAAAAPTIAVLAAALAAMSVFTVVPQILVAFSATLAADEERGRVVGTVMSGLLVGILLSRSISGVVAAAGGWRLVFALAAGGMLLLAAVLWRALPERAPSAEMAYRALLRSILTLVREEPVLRRRMAYGALAMGSFSSLWTSIAFLLSAPPYRYGEAAIGLFALFGLAGALGAQGAGRLADRGHVDAVTGAAVTTMLAGWGLLALGTHSLVALIAGIVVLDLGVQGGQIMNQSAIYALRPEARSRLTTAYMTAVFLGGAVGSAASAAAYGAGGWLPVAAFGAALAASALLLWAQERLAGSRRGVPQRV